MVVATKIETGMFCTKTLLLEWFFFVIYVRKKAAVGLIKKLVFWTIKKVLKMFCQRPDAQKKAVGFRVEGPLDNL